MNRLRRGPFQETRFQLALRGLLRSAQFDALRFLDTLGRFAYESVQKQAARWSGFVTLRQIESCFQEAGVSSWGNFVENIPEYLGDEHCLNAEGRLYVAAIVVFTNVAGMHFSSDTVGKDRVLSLCCFLSGREQASPFPSDAKVASREREFFEALVQKSIQRVALLQVFLSSAQLGLCVAVSLALLYANKLATLPHPPCTTISRHAK